MSTDDSKPGGLFSRVARFVRHPGLHWAEAEAQDEGLGLADRQVLRQTLERKRRNDLVRQREFEQLRRLRQKEAAADEAQVEASGQPSTAQSRLSPPETRAVTLQKIDAIEEQISQQWWRRKQPADASTMPMYLLSTFPQPDSVHVASATPAPSLPGFAMTAPLDPSVSPDPVATQAHESAALAATFASTLPFDCHTWEEAEPTLATPMLDVPTPAAPTPFVHDPDFEEAAIAFANGDAARAEALLQALLAQRAAQPELQYRVWLALFDLYRAAGLAERFEILATDFAVRFGCSAPQWFALSTQNPGAATDPDAPEPSGAPDWRWSAPRVLTRQAVAALQQAKAAAPAPWALLWSALERIEADAAAPLEQVFTEWAQAPGRLVFLDAPVLAQCLQALTMSGAREAPEAGWRLRMAALRLMGQRDSFELVALDYCVTYEVAPPSWVPPCNSYRELESGAPKGDQSLAPVPSAGAALSGCIGGDATQWLAELENRARPGLPLAVDCAALMRVDFAAAGLLLNWAARMQARDVALRFERLHQLVAVFFATVGISDHAQLVPRTD